MKERDAVGRSFRRKIGILAILALSAPALAQTAPLPPTGAGTAAEPAYLDDRSDPAAVIRSLYGAIERTEHVRARSYLRDEPDRPSVASFAKGYAETADVAVKTGKAVGDGAAGSIDDLLPVAVRSVDTRGKASVLTGCYELRIVQPGIQAEPPFRPLGIVRGRLEASGEDFSAATGTCPADGL